MEIMGKPNTYIMKGIKKTKKQNFIKTSRTHCLIESITLEGLFAERENLDNEAAPAKISPNY